MYLSREICDLYRCVFRLGPVLNPCSELTKKARRVSASSSSAMTHPGNLKVAVEVMDARNEGRDFIVVLDRGLRWDRHIILWTRSVGELSQNELEEDRNLADAHNAMKCDELPTGVTESRQISIQSTDDGIISLAALVS